MSKCFWAPKISIIPKWVLSSSTHRLISLDIILRIQCFKMLWQLILDRRAHLSRQLSVGILERRERSLTSTAPTFSSASLPAQQGNRVLHNNLQSIIQVIMKLGGVYSEKEAVNFLLDKVGDPHITAYARQPCAEPSYCPEGTTCYSPWPSCQELSRRAPTSEWQWRYIDGRGYSSRSKHSQLARVGTVTTMRQPTQSIGVHENSHSRTVDNSKSSTNSLLLML